MPGRQPQALATQTHLRAAARRLLLGCRRHRAAQLRQGLQQQLHRLRQLPCAAPRLLQLGGSALCRRALAGGGGLQACRCGSQLCMHLVQLLVQLGHLGIPVSQLLAQARDGRLLLLSPLQRAPLVRQPGRGFGGETTGQEWA